MGKEIVEAKFGTNPAGEFKEEHLGSVNLQKCGWCEGSIQKMVGSNWYLSYGKNGLGENCKDLGDEVETWATAWDFTQTAFVADPSLPHNSAQFFGFLRNAIVHSPEDLFQGNQNLLSETETNVAMLHTFQVDFQISLRWGFGGCPWQQCSSPGALRSFGDFGAGRGGAFLCGCSGWDGLQRCGVRAGVRTWMWMEMAYHQQLRYSRYSRYSQQHWIYDWLVIWHSSTLCSITSL